jgi:hypothetical protein
MFIIDVLINYDKIDSIQIQRIKNTKSGTNTYKIVSPKGFEKIKIRHHYDDGYLPLLINVLNTLEENGYGYVTKPKYTWKQLQKLLKENEALKKKLIRDGNA